MVKGKVLQASSKIINTTSEAGSYNLITKDVCTEVTIRESRAKYSTEV